MGWQPTKKFWGLAAVVCSLIVLLDQVTKIYLVGRIPYDSGPESHVEIISGFFWIVHEVNQGAAWGILYGKMDLLALISMIVAVGLVIYLRKLSEGYRERIAALVMLEGGVIGNLIDRLALLHLAGIYGPEQPEGVVDFLQFFIFGYRYPAFNVADIAITVGVIIFCISSFCRKSPEEDEPDDRQTGKKPWGQVLKEILRP